MSAIGKPRPPRPAPELNGHPPGIVDGNAVYRAAEFYRRMGWRRHSQREARRRGLVSVRFGSANFILGKHALEFFERLAEQQAEKSKGET